MSVLSINNIMWNFEIAHRKGQSFSVLLTTYLAIQIGRLYKSKYVDLKSKV